MKAFLMHPSRDFDLEVDLPWNHADLTQDLGLDSLFDAMAQGDEFLGQVAQRAILCAMDNDAETVAYRQAILKDCLNHPTVARQMYAIAVEAMASEKKVYFGYYGRFPPGILARAIEVLHLFAAALKRLRAISDEHSGSFESQAFTALFAMLQRELDDEYLATMEAHLARLKFPDGAPLSARLGPGNKNAHMVLRKPPTKRTGWIQRMLSRETGGQTLTLHDRDDNGARALADIRDNGISQAANVLAQAADHILSFFSMLRTELAFFIGCLNLRDRLAAVGVPMCFPRPVQAGERLHDSEGLVDASLALTLQRPIVGNNLLAAGKRLVVITGANQGGKTTYLRSLGQAQLMMHCGLYVAAEAFTANLRAGVFTHFRRQEDATMTSGKLDEELGRMRAITNHLTTGAMLLCNESFASTNDLEGSEIARQVTRALTECGVFTTYVTHLSDFAHQLYARGENEVLFLRAERQPDGRRTFKLTESPPLDTSFGRDLYDQIFAAGDAVQSPQRL